MIVASLLILVRPEGFFIGVLWGAWVLTERRRDGGDGETWKQRDKEILSLSHYVPLSLRLSVSPSILLLATGAFAWWLAAYLIMRDPLWIVHDWPSDWRPDGKANGTG